MYTYNATIDRIVDGDTLDAIVDVGFHVYLKMRFRLVGINTPERFTPEGQAATAFVQSLCWPGQSVILNTQMDKQEKYGRYLATVIVDGLNLNQELLAKGYGTAYSPAK
jgi:micrococcal nuclease